MQHERDTVTVTKGFDRGPDVHSVHLPMTRWSDLVPQTVSGSNGTGTITRLRSTVVTTVE